MDFQLSSNERRLIDIVWRRGPIARAVLADSLNLTTASVTRLVRALSERHLLEERVNRVGARGQPIRPIHVNRSALQSVGVYFSHRHVELGVIDLSGNILHARRIDSVDIDPAALGGATASFVDDAIASGVSAAGRIIGVGVAVPADFIDGARRLHAHRYFPALGVPGAMAAFAQAVPLPVFVENDAASAALGERILGAAQNIDTFLFVHIGHGVGGGVILNGRLYRGVQGNAGMIGIQFPNDRPRPSGEDLFATLRAEGVAATEFSDLEALAPHDCPPLRAWLMRAGAQLRQQLAITARLFDPEAVVIGGRLPQPLIHALAAEVNVAGFCDEGVGLPPPRVIASMLGPRAGLVGAASLPIFRVLLDGQADGRAEVGLAVDRATEPQHASLAQRT